MENTIANLQETMQDLNGLMSNSCQLAQGLVTDAFSAFEGKENMQTATGNTVKGLADSFGSLFSGSSNSKSPIEMKTDAGNVVSCEDTGNVVWCAMKQYICPNRRSALNCAGKRPVRCRSHCVPTPHPVGTLVGEQLSKVRLLCA